MNAITACSLLLLSYSFQLAEGGPSDQIEKAAMGCIARCVSTEVVFVPTLKKTGEPDGDQIKISISKYNSIKPLFGTPQPEFKLFSYVHGELTNEELHRFDNKLLMVFGDGRQTNGLFWTGGGNEYVSLDNQSQIFYSTFDYPVVLPGMSHNPPVGQKLGRCLWVFGNIFANSPEQGQRYLSILRNWIPAEPSEEFRQYAKNKIVPMLLRPPSELRERRMDGMFTAFRLGEESVKSEYALLVEEIDRTLQDANSSAGIPGLIGDQAYFVAHLNARTASVRSLAIRKLRKSRENLSKILENFGREAAGFAQETCWQWLIEYRTAIEGAREIFGTSPQPIYGTDGKITNVAEIVAWWRERM